MKTILAGSLFVAVVTGASAVSAQDESSWSLDGYFGGATDLRDRGLSLSDRDPVLSGSVGLFHDGGFSVGMDMALINDRLGNDGRTEFFVGYSLDKGDYIYDFTLELDGIHGDDSDFYPEFKASVSRDFGLAYVRGGIAYAPDGRWSTPDLDSFYTFADLEIPVPTIPELTLITHVGYDALSGGASDLWDWSVGVSAFIKDFEISLTLEDSSLDDPISNAQLVVGAKLYF